MAKAGMRGNLMSEEQGEIRRYFQRDGRYLATKVLIEIKRGMEAEASRAADEMGIKVPTPESGPKDPEVGHLVNWYLAGILLLPKERRSELMMAGKKACDERQRIADQKPFDAAGSVADAAVVLGVADSGFRVAGGGSARRGKRGGKLGPKDGGRKRKPGGVDHSLPSKN